MRPGVREPGCLAGWEAMVMLAGLVAMLAAIPVLVILS